MRDMLLSIFSGMLKKIKPNVASHVILDEFISLKNLYLEHHRHYHNWHHIAKMWGEFDDARHLFDDPIAVEFALFYHDCIYTPAVVESCNELASYQRADFVLRKLGMTDTAFVIRVKSHILYYTVGDLYANHDSIVFNDMDHAILGKSHKEYEEYRKNIAKEFVGVNIEFRISFLQSLLARKRIFRSEYFHGLYEKQAIENIERELKEI